MKAEQLDQALRQKFCSEGERLVFWHNPKGEFREYILSGLPAELEDVTVLNAATRQTAPSVPARCIRLPGAAVGTSGCTGTMSLGGQHRRSGKPGGVAASRR